MSVLTTVTEAETKVVDTVKSLKQPVVDYVARVSSTPRVVSPRSRTPTCCPSRSM
jgi:hypothetical protein